MNQDELTQNTKITVQDVCHIECNIYDKGDIGGNGGGFSIELLTEDEFFQIMESGENKIRINIPGSSERKSFIVLLEQMIKTLRDTRYPVTELKVETTNFRTNDIN